MHRLRREHICDEELFELLVSDIKLKIDDDTNNKNTLFTIFNIYADFEKILMHHLAQYNPYKIQNFSDDLEVLDYRDTLQFLIGGYILNLYSGRKN